MKIDGGMMGDLAQSGQQAAKLEALGYNGVVTAETAHDPFFPLLLAAQETQSVELTTSIAVAFSRTPMNLANIGHDLNSFSKGRFVLGLGSQIRPHITKRFSMPWSKPAARMREFISAMRAIWACWHEGMPLQFEGDFYTDKEGEHLEVLLYFLSCHAEDIALIWEDESKKEILLKLYRSSVISGNYLCFRFDLSFPLILWQFPGSFI